MLAASFTESEFAHQHANVARCFDVVSGPTKRTIWLNHERGTSAPHVFSSVVFLEPPRTVGVVEGQVFIHQEGKIQGLFFDKASVRLSRIF